MVHGDAYDERQLFHRIAEGDEEAFKQLFFSYLPRIQPVVEGIVRSEAGMKDVVQDIFMSIWLSRDKLPAIDVARNWIFRIVYHQSYKWLRQQGVRAKAAEVLQRQQLSEALTNPVEEFTDFTEIKKALAQSVRALPPQTQKIYRLSREEGLTIQAIAEQLDLSPQTVKNTLHRALTSIRSHLSQRGIYLPLILLSFFLS